MAIPDHEPVLSPKAWEFLSSLSRKQQKRLANLIHQLAESPLQLGDYQTRDSTGRRLENLRFEGYVLPIGQTAR